MKKCIISDEGMLSFVNDLMEKNKVMAPVAKGASFIFDELKDAAELRLDYTTTTLPPKKMFFPPKQNLLEFNLKFQALRRALSAHNALTFNEMMSVLSLKSCSGYWAQSF